MGGRIKIGIIGDYNENTVSQLAINESLKHSAAALAVKIKADWLPTESFLTPEGCDKLVDFDAFWVASGDPLNIEGALTGIRIARESGKPFIGTWGGFQYSLVEYARNVAGILNAGHMEMDPDTESPLFILASCPVDNPDSTPRLSGEMEITVSRDSLAYAIYSQTQVYEPFHCNYELNPDYQQQLESSGVKVSGVTTDGGTRIVEIPGRRFFIGTGFVPQMISTEDNPHPLITAFLQATIDH